MMSCGGGRVVLILYDKMGWLLYGIYFIVFLDDSGGLFQLQTIILFSFLRAKDLRTSLLTMRTRIFFTYGVHTQG